MSFLIVRLGSEKTKDLVGRAAELLADQARRPVRRARTLRKANPLSTLPPGLLYYRLRVMFPEEAAEEHRRELAAQVVRERQAEPQTYPPGTHELRMASLPPWSC